MARIEQATDRLLKHFAYHPRQYAASQMLLVPVIYLLGALMGVRDAHEVVMDAFKEWPKKSYEDAARRREHLEREEA